MPRSRPWPCSSSLPGNFVLERSSTVLRKPFMTVFGGILAAGVVALATRTISRNQEYRTPVSLWRTAVAECPQGRLRNTLGILLLAEGAHDEAMVYLREATQDYPAAHFVLGTELSLAGQPDEAIAELRQLIALLPRHSFVPAADALIGRISVNKINLPPQLSWACSGQRSTLRLKLRSSSLASPTKGFRSAPMRSAILVTAPS
jgi:tetratricopeptide (TPR) repeat protein